MLECQDGKPISRIAQWTILFTKNKEFIVERELALFSGDCFL